MLWFGMLFVVLVMFRPDGLAGMFGALRRPAAAPPRTALQPGED